MLNLSENKKTVINIVASTSAFAITTLIGFFLSPYIIRVIGVEANGFTQLAGNFTTYINIIVMALTSMAGRFIAIEYHRNNIERAQEYYSSVFAGIGILFAALSIPLILCVVFLERLINIPVGLVSDVKILFALVLASFSISSIFTVWNNVYYVSNTLYVQSSTNLVLSLLRVAIIVTLFGLFVPKVWYVGAAGLAIMIITVSVDAFFTRRFTPALRFSVTRIKLKSLLEIISSGIWRSLMSIGDLLLQNLDLLMCNIFLSPLIMGIVAIAKTITTAITGLNWSISYVFAPAITKKYARENKDKLLTEIKKACKITGFICTIPFAVFVVFGKSFFLLWLPGQDAGLLHVLSILATMQILFFAATNPLANVFNITNKLKTYTLVMLGSGVANIVFALIALKHTGYGVYAVVGISSIIGIIRNFVYTIPAAGRYIGFKSTTFFPEVLYSTVCTTLIILLGFAFRLIFEPNTWMKLIFACVVLALAGFTMNAFVIFNKNERRLLIEPLVSKIRNRG